jgi:uncharacterized membrane protein
MTDRRLRITMIVFGLIGLGVATYLTIAHYAHFTVACAANGNPCETVQHSTWSELAGVPVAVIGLIGYVVILGLLLAPQSDNIRAAQLFVILSGWGFSMYLTYREAFSIHAYCEWCLSSAAIMTILTGLSITRFLRGGDPAPAAPPAPPSLAEPAGQPVAGQPAAG